MKPASLILFFLLTIAAKSQETAQVLRGKVVNAATQRPLADVAVLVYGSTNYFSATDSSGNYKIAVEPGNYSVAVQRAHYAGIVRNNILVYAGKQQVEDFELTEVEVGLSTITVHGQGSSENTHLDLLNLQRVAAVFFDPARLASSNAGVINMNDQANSISVHGTSPNYVQWMMEGVEVVNPNHLENAGTANDLPTLNGGGVSLFSGQLLQNSGFQPSPTNPLNGNALTGTFDIKLRNGNNEKREHILQFSLLGTDLCTEGPISKSKRSSYLINARYSTVGLLSLMGINFGDEKINYQDVSWQFTFPHQKGQIRIFGVTGTSENVYRGKTDTTEITIQKEQTNINYRSLTSINGLSSVLRLTRRSFLKTVLFYSMKSVGRNSEPALKAWQNYPVQTNNYEQQKCVLLNYISLQLPKGFIFKAGASASYFVNEIFFAANDSGTVGKKINDPLLEPFISLHGFIKKKLELETGLRCFYQQRIEHFSAQPKLMLRYSITEKQSIAFNYGTGIQLHTTNMFCNDSNLSLVPGNSQSTALIHRLAIKNIIIKSELFYQHFYNIPVKTSTDFSAFNVFNEPVTFAVVSSGKARVYGCDLTVKRDFNNLYFIASGSIFKSEYEVNGIWRQARFNSNYNAVLTCGKEFKMKKNNRFMSVDLRGMMRNGFRESDPDPASDPYDYNRRLPAYYRVDLRVSFRKNKSGRSGILALDVQNLTARKNVSYNYPDSFTGKTETVYQLGLIPVLSYKLML
jgi:hypothetical protein